MEFWDFLLGLQDSPLAGNDRESNSGAMIKIWDLTEIAKVGLIVGSQRALACTRAMRTKASPSSPVASSGIIFELGRSGSRVTCQRP